MFLNCNSSKYYYLHKNFLVHQYIGHRVTSERMDRNYFLYICYLALKSCGILLDNRSYIMWCIYSMHALIDKICIVDMLQLNMR